MATLAKKGPSSAPRRQQWRYLGLRFCVEPDRIRRSRVAERPSAASELRMDASSERKELELRVKGADRPGCAGQIEAAVRAIDPEARIRIDPATGIVHAFTSCETLELTEALSRAGFEPSAMTL